MAKYLFVDPAELYVPPSRHQGADPGKLSRQIAKHGKSLDGMPPILVVRCRDGKLRIQDGVTRATRAAKLRPGERVQVEIIGEMPNHDPSKLPQIKGVLP